MLINGQWVDSASGERFPSYNPYTEEAWATIPQAAESDVDRAVQAAREAYRTVWSKTNGLERARLMMKLADLLEAEAERLAELETADNGKVIRESLKNMKQAARYYRFFAGYADKIYGEVIPMDQTHLFDYTMREPIGTVALITPWNSPISILANKLAPALAAGNTVVIKPSEHASVTTLEFGELVRKAGFPDGVVNIVTGDGTVGNFLTRHPGIGKISFTGGSATGKIIARNASENLIPCLLELGGKSPNIIFADADLDKALAGAFAGVFGGAGQTCIAGSRLLVQRPVYEQVVERMMERIRAVRLGNPMDPATDMGPLANKPHYERVLSMIRTGEAEGATVAIGGKTGYERGLEKGWFVEPTLFVDVNQRMTIAREEVFGPVLCILPFDDEEEAVAMANDSKYGLASGIWTRDISRAHRIARRMECGQVWVNTYRINAAQVPFGGVKQSGYGRERGMHTLMEYTVVKNVMVDLSV
ncbi:MAG: carnitine dehydratase [Paenibacillaceae bacterium ZCTH02-B3]|nr:MAG: carnitine dehydratase [Paenibacillaceae bacterium ZCTH02-B3]